jgi:vacuolar-type H+-ATPase subunit E/Vma4
MASNQRQIKQMVNFITQEAKEKANEIRIKVFGLVVHSS